MVYFISRTVPSRIVGALLYLISYVLMYCKKLMLVALQHPNFVSKATGVRGSVPPDMQQYISIDVHTQEYVNLAQSWYPQGAGH